MMDRHICKAKAKDSGKWITGYYFKSTGHDWIIPIDTDSDTLTQFEVDDEKIFFIEVDPKTVCRCIGWYDSYKKLIFERDIVEFDGASIDKYLIWWSNEMSMIDAIPLEGIEFNGYDYWNGNYSKYTYSDFCLMMQDPWGDFKEKKVVGNIVDNPELLEAT